MLLGVFLDRINQLDYIVDTELIKKKKKKYRLDRESIYSSVMFFPVSLQVTLPLRFYATGSFQSVTADSHGVGLDSVSKSISVVSSELTKRIDEYIRRLDSLDGGVNVLF